MAKQVITLHARQGYDRWAPLYDTNRNPLTALDDIAFRECFAFPVNHKRVIDLGCGTGRVTAKLARLGAKVTAVDFSDGMMSLARRKPGMEKVTFITRDLTKRLPFPDRSFALAVSCLTVEHIRDKKKFFAEVFRVLNRGGICYLTELHPAMPLLGTTARFTDPASGRELRPRSHVRGIADLVMSALGAGFEIQSMKEYDGRRSLLRRYPKIKRYLGWPMLLVMALRKSS
jgi:ubiquinone/menaquinone biosynthesis C-methylase UbiE